MESQQQADIDGAPQVFPPSPQLMVMDMSGQPVTVQSQQQAANSTGTQSVAPNASGSVFVSVPVSSAPSGTLPVPITTKLDTFWTDQVVAIQNVSEEHWKNPEFPLARIKKIMRMDEDVRMISAEVPIMLSKAVEVFIAELSMRAWHITEESKRRTIQRSDIAMAITNNDMYDFLIDIVPREEIQMKPAKPQAAGGGSLQLLPPDLLQLYIQHFAASASGEEDSSLLQNQLQIIQQLLQIQQLQEQQQQEEQGQVSLVCPPSTTGLTSTGSILDTQVLQASDTQELTPDVLEQLRQQVASGDYSLLRRIEDSGLLEGGQSMVGHPSQEPGALGPEFVDPAMDIDSLTHQVLHSVHPMSMASDPPVVTLPAEFGLVEPTSSHSPRPGTVAFSSTPLRLTHVHGGSSLVQLSDTTNQ